MKLLSIAMCLVACFFASSVTYGDDLEFASTATGAQEVVFDINGNFVPGGTATDAVGRTKAKFDAGLTKVEVNLRIKNLVGNFTRAHFHCGRPGQNGPIAFGLVDPGPLAFDGERVRGTLTNSDFTGADCTPVIGRPVNNIAALAAAMRDGLIYLNVHSDAFPAGEIRGQMMGANDSDK